jgi:AcrR family transcriptional regulator
MRVKTDEKKREILMAAAAVFEEKGYLRASMAAISERLGGSKATLYGYFRSKEALFAATVTRAVEEMAIHIFDALDPDNPDVGAVLREFGYRYLTFLTSPEVQVLMRGALEEYGNDKLGAELYEIGPRRAWRVVEDYLIEVTAKGWLRVASPMIAAYQLKGLYEAGILEPVLYGIEPPVSHDQAVENAALVFMKAYGTETPARS